MRFFAWFCALCLPFSAQASISSFLNDLFTDNESYIETTKGIEFDNKVTTEDIVVSLLEVEYFADKNPDVPSVDGLVLKTGVHNAEGILLSMSFGNTKPLEKLLAMQNYDCINIEPSNVSWRVDGSTKKGKVVVAEYETYSVKIETEDDGDYISLSADNIYAPIAGTEYSFSEATDDDTIASYFLYVDLLNKK